MIWNAVAVDILLDHVCSILLPNTRKFKSRGVKSTRRKFLLFSQFYSTFEYEFNRNTVLRCTVLNGVLVPEKEVVYRKTLNHHSIREMRGAARSGGHSCVALFADLLL
jgi:hypothetical protein